MEALKGLKMLFKNAWCCLWMLSECFGMLWDALGCLGILMEVLKGLKMFFKNDWRCLGILSGCFGMLRDAQ